MYFSREGPFHLPLGPWRPQESRGAALGGPPGPGGTPEQAPCPSWAWPPALLITVLLPNRLHGKAACLNYGCCSKTITHPHRRNVSRTRSSGVSQLQLCSAGGPRSPWRAWTRVAVVVFRLLAAAPEPPVPEVGGGCESVSTPVVGVHITGSDLRTRLSSLGPLDQLPPASSPAGRQVCGRAAVQSLPRFGFCHLVGFHTWWCCVPPAWVVHWHLQRRRREERAGRV